MAKKNKDDKETSGIRHILSGLIKLSESDAIEDMVKCFDNLVINSKKYEQIEGIVNMNNKEYAKMIRIIDEVVKKSEAKNG